MGWRWQERHSHLFKLNLQHFRCLLFQLSIIYIAYNDWCLILNRYGSIFKSHILGCPCVMISSPEEAKLVLVSKAHLFKPTFPASKERMLGKQAIFFQQGEYHTKLRKLVLTAFMPETIKNKILDIESTAVSLLQSWEGRLINTFQEMKTVCFAIFPIT